MRGAAAYSDPFPSQAPMRLLVLADNFGASQSIAFVEGLAGARSRGEVAVCIFDEASLGPDRGLRGLADAREVIEDAIAQTAATHLIVSRFAHGAGYAALREASQALALPLFAHIDDDLFDMPVTVGVERYRIARHPRRVRTLLQSLAEADRVICATPALAHQLVQRIGHGRIGWLENGTAGRPWPRTPGLDGARVVIGYMGSGSHGADLEMIAPALNAVARRADVRLELFGSIARQGAAEQLAGAVVRHPIATGGYGGFKAKLTALGWDIGLAPLQATPYNRCKTATKWAEYAEAGIAVLASDIEVYRPMADAGAALLARPDGWKHALERLIESAALRADLVSGADRLLRSRFGWERLEASVLGLLRQAPSVRCAA